jgi:hypothetical protein
VLAGPMNLSRDRQVDFFDMRETQNGSSFKHPVRNSGEERTTTAQGRSSFSGESFHRAL